MAGEISSLGQQLPADCGRLLGPGGVRLGDGVDLACGFQDLADAAHLFAGGVAELAKAFDILRTLLDELGSGARCFDGASGEAADLLGDDDEAFAGIACAGRFDGSIQRQQLGLKGDKM